MYDISVTFATLVKIGPTNEDAPLNIPNIVVTSPAFHVERFWLKLVAVRNMFFVSVTLATFHPEIA